MKIWKHDIVCISKLEDILNRMQKENKKIEEIIPYSYEHIAIPESNRLERRNLDLECVLIIYTEED